MKMSKISFLYHLAGIIILLIGYVLSILSSQFIVFMLSFAVLLWLMIIGLEYDIYRFGEKTKEATPQ